MNSEKCNELSGCSLLNKLGGEIPIIMDLVSLLNEFLKGSIGVCVLGSQNLSWEVVLRIALCFSGASQIRCTT